MLLNALRPLDQNVRNLRSAKLHWGPLAGFQQVADFGAAGGDFVFGAVGAGFAADDGFALFAPGGVFEFQQGDADFFGDVELVEDGLGVVGAVVGADAGVVAADDEVGLMP